jgi:hypothetical protein
VGALALALLTCLTVDVSNPLLPGVVRLDDGESIYWLRAERPRVDDRAPAAAAPKPRGRVRVLAIEPPTGGGPAAVSGETGNQRRPGWPRSTLAVTRGALAADEDH